MTIGLPDTSASSCKYCSTASCEKLLPIANTRSVSVVCPRRLNARDTKSNNPIDRLINSIFNYRKNEQTMQTQTEKSANRSQSAGAATSPDTPRIPVQQLLRCHHSPSLSVRKNTSTRRP